MAQRRVRPRSTQRALPRHLSADCRELSRNRRARRFAQHFALDHDPDLARLRAERDVGPRAARSHLRSAYLGWPPAHRASGLRFFVDALMEIGDLGEADRREMEAKVAAAGKSMEAVLSQASGMLRASRARLGWCSRRNRTWRLKHIEFVRLEPERSLVILVSDDGQVENRVITVPAGLPASSLTEAANFLNAHARGRTLAEAKTELEEALAAGRAELDQVTQKLIATGLASWSGGESDERKLIVRGAAHLLDDLKAVEDLERVRLLFDDLETKRGVIDLLGRAESAEGARIFIGSENKLFSLSGSSTIVAPYRDGAGRIVGVIGVIGPTRLNYARVIPMVDYTAKVVSNLIGS